ncbi:hypothetical protein [Chryseobacterium sp. T1]
MAINRLLLQGKKSAERWWCNQNKVRIYFEIVEVDLMEISIYPRQNFTIEIS